MLLNTSFAHLWTRYVYIQDAANEIVAALQGKPDLIIGNYSDGNLVASLVANKFGIIQVFSP
jgi:hypothetical protein